jgi:outer membrane lipoprotein
LPAALVLGCALPISKNLRQQAVDITIHMVAENPEGYKGDTVIWGGRIIKTINHKHGTEICILATPLDYRERPEDETVTLGRFIAKTSDYLDPVVYSNGKSVTVAGTIEGIETHPVGERDYVYPVVDIKELHLFRPEVTYVYPDWYYWGSWGPDWYGGPFYYGGPEFYYSPRFHGGHGHEEFEEHEHGESGEHGEGGGMEHEVRGK